MSGSPFLLPLNTEALPTGNSSSQTLWGRPKNFSLLLLLTHGTDKGSLGRNLGWADINWSQSNLGSRNIRREIRRKKTSRNFCAKHFAKTSRSFFAKISRTFRRSVQKIRRWPFCCFFARSFRSREKKKVIDRRGDRFTTKTSTAKSNWRRTFVQTGTKASRAYYHCGLRDGIYFWYQKRLSRQNFWRNK